MEEGERAFKLQRLHFRTLRVVILLVVIDLMCKVNCEN